MVYSVLLSLASSKRMEDYTTLCNIIEEVCHPLMYDNNEELAGQCENKFKNLLKYDHFDIVNGKI